VDEHQNLPEHETLITANSPQSKRTFWEFTEKKLLYHKYENIPGQRSMVISEILPSQPAIEMPKKTVIFTACSVNYLAKAMAMCLSALDHHADVALVILLVDRKRPVTLLDHRVHLMWAEDINFPDYLQCAFKYNIIELNTALKPFVALKLLVDYEKVIYLDPDVCVFSPLTSVISSLDDHSTVFTPHAVSPYLGSGRPSDQDLLRFGCFNLGFFAANDSADAQKLLKWWHRQCLVNCFYEPQVGLGVDQKWIDLAPAFFDGVHILKNLGLNVAFWNLHERQLKKSQTGWLVNDVVPLGFVHFSSFVEADRSVVADKQTRYETGTRLDFSEVGDVYRQYLDSAKRIVHIENSNYGYAQFDNDSSISPSLRRFYAVHKEERFKDCLDPFIATGPVYRFAHANNLLSFTPVVVAHTNFKAATGYLREQRIISTAFRWVLRLLGPDRYFTLLRYLAHYSSILNQTDLLKR
jgi:hypothetical protein